MSTWDDALDNAKKVVDDTITELQSESAAAQSQLVTVQANLDAARATIAQDATTLANTKAADAQALADVQSAFDAYKATHPDTQPPPPPPPPPSKVAWGFNLFNSWNGYTQGTSESAATMLNRLKNDFGTFSYGKVFYSGFLPATFAAGVQGEANPANPGSHTVLSFQWADGSIANGSHDAAIIAYAKSVPAGKHVMLCKNEIDNHSPNWASYVADMDHLYDLLKAQTLSGKVEVWDCFMEWSLEAASGPAWKDTWTNPKKRHGIVWDNYWNKATVDKTGKTAVGNIVAKMKQLGMTRWVLGETGDRRPGTANSVETNDTTRAASLTNRLNALLTAEIKPEAILWFDVIGSTGDHRIIPASDPITQGVLKSYMHA